MLAPPAYPYERYSVLSPLASPELLRSVVTLLHESVETAVMNDWFSIFFPLSRFIQILPTPVRFLNINLKYYK